MKNYKIIKSYTKEDGYYAGIASIVQLDQDEPLTQFLVLNKYIVPEKYDYWTPEIGESFYYVESWSEGMFPSEIMKRQKNSSHEYLTEYVFKSEETVKKVSSALNAVIKHLHDKELIKTANGYVKHTAIIEEARRAVIQDDES